MIPDGLNIALWFRTALMLGHIIVRSSMSLRVSEYACEHSGPRQQSKQCGASTSVSGASERATGQASGPVSMFRFLAVLIQRA